MMFTSHKPIARFHRNSLGFTLVEMMVATGLVVLMMLMFAANLSDLCRAG